jgi:hypothetical protein
MMKQGKHSLRHLFMEWNVARLTLCFSCCYVIPRSAPFVQTHPTGSHPETVRKFTRRFEQQGLLGLLPEAVALIPKGPTLRVPPEVLEEIGRLKALYEGLQYQELVRIVLCTCGYQMTDKTAKRLWQQSPAAPQGALPLGDYHSYPDRAEARLEVLQRYAQGGNKLSISRVLHVSRPTVDRWMQRFEEEHVIRHINPPFLTHKLAKRPTGRACNTV